VFLLLTACGTDEPSDGQAAKMRNCPVTVPGADVAATDVERGIRFDVRADSAEGEAEVRRRAREVVARTSTTRSGRAGKSGGFMRRCPVVTQDTRIAVVEIDGGAALTVTPSNGADPSVLREESRARLARLPTR